MILSNDLYTVVVAIEDSHSREGSPVIYRPEYLDPQEVGSGYQIRVSPKAGQPFSLLVMDLYVANTDRCAVLEGNILTVVLFEAILQIDLETACMIQCVSCENVGGLEQIWAVSQGYIIKGESDIFRYDFALKQVWHFSARDIFALPTAESCFWIDQDKIHCRDWEGWHYVLDFDGTLIEEVREKSPPG